MLPGCELPSRRQGEPSERRGGPLSAENRLTAEQLAALGPGDQVTIESGAEFRAPKLTDATVISVTESRITVRCSGRAGGIYVENYSRRDGQRVGRGMRGQLVNRTATEQTDGRRAGTQRIDAAYRQWARNRADLDALRALQAAIADHLGQ